MRRVMTATTLLLPLLILVGCAGSEDPPMPSTQAPSSVTSTPSPGNTQPVSPTRSPEEADDGPALTVSVTDDAVGPNARRIKLRRGESLAIRVTADRPGQLHVHSKPDQYVNFTEGLTKATVTISTPGLVDVEEHDTGIVIAQLEVR